MKSKKNLVGVFLSVSLAASVPVFAQQQQTMPSQVLKMLPDQAKRTIMFDYVNLGMNDAVLDLIDQAGFDPNMADANGMTALMIAAAKGNTNMAVGLISRGADKAATDKVKNWTAEEWAKNNGHEKTAMFISQFEKSMTPGKSTP